MTDLAVLRIAPGQGSFVTGQRLDQVLRGKDLGGFKTVSRTAACLVPILTALGWRGEIRHLAEALPHFSTSFDEYDLVSVLTNLGYETRTVPARLKDLETDLLPCLFMPEDGAPLVVLSLSGGRLTVFDATSGGQRECDAGPDKGTAYLVSERPKTDPSKARPSDKWVAVVAGSFRGVVIKMFAITFATNLLALLIPVYIMMVYDKVVAARSPETLAYLAAGIGLVVLLDAALRVIRSRLLAYVGARIDVILSVAAFRQILSLPLSMTENAPIGGQMARIKQFESIREFFIGPLATVVLDLPFVFLFIALIAVIAGPLAWIPMALLVVFLVLGTVMGRTFQKRIRESGEARSKRQHFLIEMLTNMRALKQSAAEIAWRERFRDISAETAIAHFRVSQASARMQTLGQFLMYAAGVATITLGTVRVAEHEMSIGALIATMAMVWRILTPLQTAFLSLANIEQIKLGIEQVNRLMNIPAERDPSLVASMYRRFKGRIVFQNVSMRYAPQAEPALLGVNLSIQPGEIVAITGPSGSGKSTLLKHVAGLYEPQAGMVTIDGLDVRQLDPGELRHAIGYVPQVCNLFHGTVAQNLRLGNSMAGDSDLTAAIVDADLMDYILQLPDGLDSWLKDRELQQMPLGIKQKLMLARAYATHAPIFLLDDPGSAIDEEGDNALCRKLQALKGRATVLIATHRPRHMRLADRVVHIDGGRVLRNGPPEAVLPELFARPKTPT
jgi:ATP-binding cassette subfamily C protein/ATP-binding cassette subfamily C protein LapB